MLDLNKVLLLFRQISGCGMDKMNDEVELVKNAVLRLEDMLDTEKVTESDYGKCEYAGACIAVYDFVCKSAVTEKLIVTAEGKASRTDNFAEKIASAERLKCSAMAGLKGLLKDEDFVFETVGGMR